MFGSRHSCLVSGSVLVLCRGSDTHATGLFLLWESRVRTAVCSSVSVHSLSSFGFLLFCLVLSESATTFAVSMSNCRSLSSFSASI